MTDKKTDLPIEFSEEELKAINISKSEPLAITKKSEIIHELGTKKTVLEIIAALKIASIPLESYIKDLEFRYSGIGNQLVDQYNDLFRRIKYFLALVEQKKDIPADIIIQFGDRI